MARMAHDRAQSHPSAKLSHCVKTVRQSPPNISALHCPRRKRPVLAVKRPLAPS
jgi:hypothetical protein